MAKSKILDSSIPVAGLILFGLTLLGLFVAYLINPSSFNETSATTALVQPKQAISVSQIQIANARLSCASPTETWPECYYEGDGQYVLTAEVTNNSSIPFESIYLTVDMYDCPAETIDSSCTHIGHETDAYLGVDGASYGEFEPGITTEASAFPGISGIPPIQGNLLWTYSVTTCSNGNGLCGFWNGVDMIPVVP